MSTFILKKYDTEAKTPEVTPEQKEEAKKPEENQIKIININGSISEIVAKSLQESLKNDGKQLEEVASDLDEVEKKEVISNISTITTEEINKDPVVALRKVDQGSLLYIESKGFSTKPEDWFLTNVGNRTKRVFYTLESLTRYVISQTD